MLTVVVPKSSPFPAILPSPHTGDSQPALAVTVQPMNRLDGDTFTTIPASALLGTFGMLAKGKGETDMPNRTPATALVIEGLLELELVAKRTLAEQQRDRILAIVREIQEYAKAADRVRLDRIYEINHGETRAA